MPSRRCSAVLLVQAYVRPRRCCAQRNGGHVQLESCPIERAAVCDGYCPLCLTPSLSAECAMTDGTERKKLCTAVEGMGCWCSCSCNTVSCCVHHPRSACPYPGSSCQCLAVAHREHVFKVLMSVCCEWGSAWMLLPQAYVCKAWLDLRLYPVTCSIPSQQACSSCVITP
jgi:hypothetical protein